MGRSWACAYLLVATVDVEVAEARQQRHTDLQGANPCHTHKDKVTEQLVADGCMCPLLDGKRRYDSWRSCGVRVAYVCLLERAHVVGAVTTHEAKQPTVLPTNHNTQKVKKGRLL